MKQHRYFVAACRSLPIMAVPMANASAAPLSAPADLTAMSHSKPGEHSPRPHASTPHARAASCVVDVSDWPIGILPDDASAAFGPTVLAACIAAVADWPSGALPEDPCSLFGA